MLPERKAETEGGAPEGGTRWRHAGAAAYVDDGGHGPAGDPHARGADGSAGMPADGPPERAYGDAPAVAGDGPSADGTKPVGAAFGEPLSAALFIAITLAFMFMAFAAYAGSVDDGFNIWDPGSYASLFGHGEEAVRSVRSFAAGTDGSVRYAAYGGVLAVVSRGLAKWVDSEGRDVFAKLIQANNPTVRAAGGYMAVGDYGGTSAYLYRGAERMFELTVEGLILSVDVNADGYVSIVREMKGYACRLEVYDREGRMVMARSQSRDHILASSYSGPSRELLFLSANVDGVGLASVLSRTDGSGETKVIAAYDGPFMRSILPADGGAYIVGDRAVSFYDAIEGRIAWTNEYRAVHMAALGGGGVYLAVELGDDPGHSVGRWLLWLGEGGVAAERHRLGGEPSHMDCVGGTLAVAMDRRILLFDGGLSLLEEHFMQGTVTYMRHISEGRLAVAMEGRAEILGYYLGTQG